MGTKSLPPPRLFRRRPLRPALLLSSYATPGKPQEAREVHDGQCTVRVSLRAVDQLSLHAGDEIGIVSHGQAAALMVLMASSTSFESLHPAYNSKTASWLGP